MHEDITIKDGETLDILCGEKVALIQKKDGYRFSIDSILISNFVRLKNGERVLDIGSGCGVIPIYLSKKGFKNRFMGVEIQKELFSLCNRNKLLNRCDNIEFVHGDIRIIKDKLKADPFDVIISNPPYTKESSGRKSPKSSKLVARCERTLKLEEIMEVSKSLLKFLGRLYLIYPAHRLTEVIYNGKVFGLEPKRLRFVHSRMNERATLVLLEFIKGAKSNVIVEKPLYVYNDSNYTEEVKGYYLI
ncbi:MAG: methyltransferase [Deltaproteobacteria bacterium]|nr:methyltransferase [Deltaproteobacteria bacterium]